MRIKFFTGIFFLTLGFSTLSQTDTGKASFSKIIKVTNNIYMLQSDGGNIGLNFGKDGIFMVDDQYTDEVEEMKKEIKKLSNKPVRFVVNTHFHSDHTAGNALLAKEGAVIVSQEETRNRLKTMIKEGPKKLSEAVLSMITFKDEMTFYFNNEEIVLFHVANAHTDGDAMIYFTNSNVLQTGDVFVNGQYPFIDVENGGSIKGYVEGIQKALSLADEATHIIPGHGPVATYKELSDNLRFLSITYKKITQLAALGKTEDEVATMKDLTEIYTSNGYKDGFISADSFIRTLYKEATMGKSNREERIKENEKAQVEYDKLKKKQEIKTSRKKN